MSSNQTDVSMFQSVAALSAECRDGQVFLQWQENRLPAGSLLNVYRHSKPIIGETLPHAIRIGHHIQPGSAWDWWNDPSYWKKGDAPKEAMGYVIRSGLSPLNPASGLFVHTVTADEGEQQYYAVTVSLPDGTEDRGIVVGENSLQAPVAQRKMPTQAIWLGKGAPPAIPTNLPVIFRLHGGAGAYDSTYNYVAFGDASTGWRESLAFKFKIVGGKKALYISPSDRVWYNRALGGIGHFNTESGIACHFGYNSNIYDQDAMKNGTIVNYNEKRLLWILEWCHRTFQTDPNRVHATGASGGGAGLMLALHYPTVFASICAGVPCVSYKNAPDATAASHDAYPRVLKMLCGEYDGRIPYASDLSGFDYLDGVSCLEKHREFPFIIIYHGRNDVPTPWSKNPSFYRALDRHRVGYTVWWDNGQHGTAGKDAPEDVKQSRLEDFLLQFSKTNSFPAFSNCSDNKNPGNGDPKDGDIIGWMNRGFKWSDIADSEHHYSISVRIEHPDVNYPVTADMTIQNAQKFKPCPVQTLSAVIGQEPPRSLSADKNGAVTIPGVAFSSADPQRIEIRY